MMCELYPNKQIHQTGAKGGPGYPLTVDQNELRYKSELYSTELD